MNRILIFEPDAREALHLSQFYQNSGFAVATVNTARQAVSFVREYEFEAMLASLSTEEMGYTAVAEVKSRAQGAKVAVLAILPDESLSVAAREAGCDDCVVRPVENDELLRKTVEILENTQKPEQVIRNMDAETNSQQQPAFGSLADSLCEGVKWLETRVDELGDQGPIAIESMRDAALSLRDQLHPEKVSPGSDLPDSVRDHRMRHDFRNLLAAVNGFSEILLLDDGLVGDVRERVSVIKKESREFCNLLDAIRDSAAA